MNITKEQLKERIEQRQSEHPDCDLIITKEKYLDGKSAKKKVKIYDTVEQFLTRLYDELGADGNIIEINYDETFEFTEIKVENGVGIFHQFEAIYLCPRYRVSMFFNPQGQQFTLSTESMYNEIDEYAELYYPQI